jgi:hypothetical protein
MTSRTVVCLSLFTLLLLLLLLIPPTSTLGYNVDLPTMKFVFTSASVLSTPVNALEQCKTVDKFVDFQSHNFSSPSSVEFIVYANVTHLFHLSFDTKIRVGIPGELGYKCTFFHDDQNPKLVEYHFPAGSIIPKQEFFICVDNLVTREDNCETHRYTVMKNPEVIDLRLRNVD